MVDHVKVLIAEKNGTELEYNEEYALEAINVPFDATSSELISDNIQEAIVELENKTATSASPGFSFGRGGNIPSGTWLLNEGVPSNKAGRRVYIGNAIITKIFANTESLDTYGLSIYIHDGNEENLTLMGQVSVVASKGQTFSTSISVTTDTQLAILVSSGSAKNIVVGLELQGTDS